MKDPKKERKYESCNGCICNCKCYLIDICSRKEEYIKSCPCSNCIVKIKCRRYCNEYYDYIYIRLKTQSVLNSNSDIQPKH